MSVSNVRLYDFGNCQQIRVYNNPIITGKDRQAPLPKDMETQRTRKDVEHSAKVSVNRSKKSIYEISRANDWEYFITLTFDRNKIDSSDYQLCIKTVGKYFNNLKQRKCPNIKYLIVPELHKDGVHYHFHGLLANCEGLEFVDSGIVHGTKKVYNIPSFGYGFTTATKVEDTKRVANYIGKYITKELETRIKGKRRFVASRNCKKAEVTEYYMNDTEIENMVDSLTENIVDMKTKSFEGYCVRYIEVQ